MDCNHPKQLGGQDQHLSIRPYTSDSAKLTRARQARPFLSFLSFLFSSLFFSFFSFLFCPVLSCPVFLSFFLSCHVSLFFLSFFSFVASRLTSPNAPRLGTLSDQRPSVGAVAGTPCYVWLTRSKCIASSNKCLTSSNKKLLVNSCFGRVFVSTVFTPSEQLKGRTRKGRKAVFSKMYVKY